MRTRTIIIAACLAMAGTAGYLLTGENQKSRAQTATTPVDLSRIQQADLEKEIARNGITAELDAIDLYEQMASMSKNATTRKVLLDIAREEKTHVGEFQALLVSLDAEQKTELENGKKEVEAMSRS
jgi:rubrerythrin